MQAGARIALDRVGGEVLELGERLEAGVAAADEDVGQSSSRRAGSSVAFASSSVSTMWLRSQIASARLLKPIACWSSPGTGSERHTEPSDEQELVVGQLLGLAVVVGQLDRPGGRIVGGDGAQAQVGALEEVAQRRDHVARLERARRGLRQQRRVEQEVDVVDEDQPGRLLRQQPLELASGVRPRESSPGDDDVLSHVDHCCTL